MLAVMQDVARAIMGMSELAQRTGLSRESLIQSAFRKTAIRVFQVWWKFSMRWDWNCQSGPGRAA